jgi:hypothetical protein
MKFSAMSLSSKVMESALEPNFLSSTSYINMFDTGRLLLYLDLFDGVTEVETDLGQSHLHLGMGGVQLDKVAVHISCFLQI